MSNPRLEAQRTTSSSAKWYSNLGQGREVISYSWIRGIPCKSRSAGGWQGAGLWWLKYGENLSSKRKSTQEIKHCGREGWRGTLLISLRKRRTWQDSPTEELSCQGSEWDQMQKLTKPDQWAHVLGLLKTICLESGMELKSWKDRAGKVGKVEDRN